MLMAVVVLDLQVSTARADANAYAYLAYVPLIIFGALLSPISLFAGMKTPHYEKLFNGKNLELWNYVGNKSGEFIVTNGVMVCPSNSTGKLVTALTYSDFALVFQYKLEAGAEGGISIRGQMSGENLTDAGVEIPLVNDNAPAHSHLEPSQRNGSIYGFMPAKHGTAKIGKWNKMRIICVGRCYEIDLNGERILHTDLNDIRDIGFLGAHPGMLRRNGHISLIGHAGQIEFRHIYIKEFPDMERDNKSPKAFKALFNGKNLNGWEGLMKDPPQRAKMTPEELTAEQIKSDAQMRAHWRAENGQLTFDGKGDNLCTKKDYGDFELQVDWRIPEKGGGGISLRGSPQVRIWETNSAGQFTPPDGSGGLYNNENGSLHPLKYADKPVGIWNQFRILMIGDKVLGFLNDELVVNDETLENYRERDKPIYPTGAIELQGHGSPVWFKNIYIREIPRK